MGVLLAPPPSNDFLVLRLAFMKKPEHGRDKILESIQFGFSGRSTQNKKPKTLPIESILGLDLCGPLIGPCPPIQRFPNIKAFMHETAYAGQRHY